MSRYSFLIVVASAGPALAQVISYEGSSFPDDEGWDRIEVLHPADRWLKSDDGDWWFFQQAEIVDPGPPAVSEQDFYRYELLPLAGSTTFFLDWVVEADGDADGIPNVSPAPIVAGGQAGILYHFTIAEEKERFIRDALLPVVWVDIEPRVPHTHHLEIRGDLEYLWYVDGALVDSGIPEGFYPTSDSRITFGVRAGLGVETTRWSHIRFGVMPEPASGDWDSDQDLDLDDVYFFQECLSNSGPCVDAGAGCVWADMDQDDDVDFHDFALFQRAFTLPE